MQQNKLNKLELTWIGKYDERKPLEPRILIENKDYSYGEPETGILPNGKPWNGNMLIHGDNLLALKALEQDYAGQVKCIYIDPPYNTGQAFEYYDDGLEVSIWLSLMYQRLELLKNLLAKDGVIFVQIDDNYMSHLRLIMNELFGKSAYINTITVKTKETSGASGGGEDRRLKKNIEFILCYGKENFMKFNDVYQETELSNYLEDMRVENKSFKYTTVFISTGEKTYYKTIKDGSNQDIIIYKHTNYQTKSVKKIAEENAISEIEVYNLYFDRICTTENAQTSIRTRVQEATDTENSLYSIEYIPISGKNKGKKTEVLFIGEQKRLVSWFKNVAEQKRNYVFKKEKVGTFWDGFNWNNVTREGGVRFPKGQKPEMLIQRIIELSTNENDIVLDSFLGSGTTAAVAQKMGRRYIGIELGEHAYTHCVPRLKMVTEGTDQGGISKAQNWQGGSGFKFYELAPSLLKKDKFGNLVINKEYNADMLAAAMAKQEGYTYQPSQETYWKQGFGSETDYIYTTTQFLTVESLAAIHETMAEDESLLICCTSFQRECKQAFSNISIKKIPQMLLGRCEFGKDDYSLNIIEVPEVECEEEMDEEE
ncbi:site-specific DNA-methyltransferase [Bacteroides sp. ET489]|uniref:site-specific DNA-methyltransferase n=1 Tax=Bacteroides sp. ET489 TaxID=3057126 RepID=UPI002673DA69|nr:site-specific DNA-methyltransferase [Bacteroides sp. ET489]MDO3391433.1 site-specific DNA-methyltransferase [Bacteroides sp. ET489]